MWGRVELRAGRTLEEIPPDFVQPEVRELIAAVYSLVPRFAGYIVQQTYFGEVELLGVIEGHRFKGVPRAVDHVDHLRTISVEEFVEDSLIPEKEVLFRGIVEVHDLLVQLLGGLEHEESRIEHGIARTYRSGDFAGVGGRRQVG